MDKLISFIVPTRNFQVIKAQFDQFERSTADLSTIEFLIKFDSDQEGAKEFIEEEIKKRKFTIKYIITPRLEGTFSLWIAMEQLFSMVSKDTYFVQIMSDEPYYKTHHWDTILRKYIHYYQDDVFRLRLSSVKFSNYASHYECAFRCDSFPIYTRRWLELTEGVGDCWGSDAYQQCIAFHLSLGPGSYYNFYREGTICRDISVIDIEMGGLEFGVGIDRETQKIRHLCNLKEWRRLSSFKMQEHFSYLARRIQCYIWAAAHCTQPFTLVRNKKNKTVVVVDEKSNVLFKSKYRMPRLIIFTQNFVRDIRTNYFIHTRPVLHQCYISIKRSIGKAKKFTAVDLSQLFSFILMRPELTCKKMTTVVYNALMLPLTLYYARENPFKYHRLFKGIIIPIKKAVKNALFLINSRLFRAVTDKQIVLHEITGQYEILYYNPPGIGFLCKKTNLLLPGIKPMTSTEVDFGRMIITSIANCKLDFRKMQFWGNISSSFPLTDKYEFGDMVTQVESPGRLSECIDKSLAQLKNVDSVAHYPITKNDLFVWEHCPLCQSTHSKRISEVYLEKELLFFTTDICIDCAHIFRAISPNTAWFVSRWLQISTGELRVYNPPLEEKRKIRYELYYGLLHKYKSSGLVLDIGAAYGSGTTVFLNKGFDAEALEPEHDRAEYISKVYNIPVHNCIIEDFNPKSKKYDVVLFSHCLEHLNDPLSELIRVKDWLNDEGVLYIEIPIAWKVVDWQDALFMAHKHNFTEKNLKNIMEKTGYNIIDSYLIPDNDGPFCNLALIAVKSTHPQYVNYNWADKEKNLLDPKFFNIDDLIKLYRIQLPVSNMNDEVLKYNVPYINHFFHILKTDRQQCVLDSGFLSYSKEGYEN